MTTFTASEVRETAIAIGLIDMPDTARMLHAYADRLEADEKAMPVAWRSVSLPTTFICDAPKNLDYEKWEPLYTHPAPADAERLAEALRAIDSAMQGVLPYFEIRRSIGTVEFPESAHGVAVRALAAHSAQAQPPAASVTDVSAKYHELLFAVQKKFPNESRHATALRYIQQMELTTSEPTLAAQESTNGL